jgi:hypothetical protein
MCECRARQKGAAALLMEGIVATAIKAQKEGGQIVEVQVDLDEPAAAVIGLWGPGRITLTMLHSRMTSSVKGQA